jgi:tetratricopeptide (TPR) repeat protein
LYNDAELALTGAHLPQIHKGRKSIIDNHHIPNGAAGFYLLGVVLEKQQKKK